MLDDGDNGGDGYTAAVAAARTAARDPGATLSARVLDELVAGKSSFFDWTFERAIAFRQELAAHAFAPGRLEALRERARASLGEAAERETAPEPPFAEYLAGHLGSATVSGARARGRNL